MVGCRDRPVARLLWSENSVATVDITRHLLTNSAYGFPNRGGRRRIAPRVLAVIHITDNRKNQGSDAAMNERNYANRRNSPGPSAHFYIGRDGGGVKAIYPINYAAWSNGDVRDPDMTNRGVQRLVALRKRGFNVNEGCGIEIECVGYAERDGQITDAQVDRLANLVAWYSSKFGLPINRNTVLTHADINSVSRNQCAFLPRLREEYMQRIIQAAKEIKHPLPKTVTLTWDDEQPDNLNTIVTWTPAGYKVTEE